MPMALMEKRSGRTDSVRRAAAAAAPVGVTSSPSTSTGESVNPAASAMNAVAGAGTGMRPCWQRTVPYPQGRSDTTTPSGAKSSAATAMAMMSAMESTAPTSWK